MGWAVYGQSSSPSAFLLPSSVLLRRCSTNSCFNILKSSLESLHRQKRLCYPSESIQCECCHE